MDTNASRCGDFRAFGIERISYSVPDSFFPLEDATTSSTTINGSDPSAQTWSNHFEGPRVQTQLRAWSRVEWPSLVARNFSGIIMKRVGFPLPCDTDAPTITQLVSPNNIDINVLAEDGMPTRRVVRRLNSYRGSDEECWMTGQPLSSLEMMGIKMRAISDVAHCLRIYSTCTTRAETRQRRAGHYVQTIPVKRRARTVPGAGNKLRTYTEISQLPRVSPEFRVPARRLSPLPRRKATSSALSPIALFTPHQEPVTPAAVMEPPPCMSDAKSPTKRSPRHKSPPIKNEGPRISEPAVKLLPAATPKIEPSPIKPASPPPATPLGENRSLRGGFATPSTLPRAAPFGTAFAGMQRLSALRPSGAASSFSPTKVLATPCPAHHSIGSSRQPSLEKPMLPVMETPRRPAAAEPMTPRIFSDISYITADVPSPIAFVSTLFAESPAKQPVRLQAGTPQKPGNFDFGTASPAFNSVTWLNDTEATPRIVASLKKKSSRRQSEPLLRGCLKAQNRRQTMSPQKLVFKADQTFSPSKGSPVNCRQTISHVKLMPEIERAFTGSSSLFSPVKKAAQPQASTAVKSASPRIARSQRPRRSWDNKSSIGRRRSANEVVNIDMRQNSDIFGTMAVSYGVSPVLGAALPSIVESGSEMESHKELAEPKLFSPSVEIESREGVEEKRSVQIPAELEKAAVQNAPVSMSANGPVDGPDVSQSLPIIDSPVISIEEHKEVSDAEPSVIAQSPSPATLASTSASPSEQKLSPSPTLNLSFTPVNSRSPSTVEASVQGEESIPESPPTVTTEIVETVTASSHDYDSPGRDYMREFIRRSRPKRPSTTEAGSPVGVQGKRQPLGAKSPNTESPTKNKRKHEKDHDQHESPLKRTLAASPKTMRRYAKNSVNKAPRAGEVEEEQTETLDVQPTTESAIADEEDDTGSDSTSRRSSRLRNQTRLPSAKSAIPTPIKIGRTSGPTLNSAVRSVQQDLTNQTRMNTRKNKGNAEYPAQFLAKQSEEAQAVPEPEPAERESWTDKDGRKCVNWSNPLAMYQEDSRKEEKEKSKKAKPSKPKTVQMSGIAKPVTRAKTTADKARTARLAEHFGMVSNGTPAKPQRSTRSRMRI
ncbi:hypothetical protein ISF_04988 [Cordyceps fumosorosea ARSEF 2679]|uniref:Uncharacterized protein n=1 Tax=Cordyceps fumosorosea (strain ARSEF 2679) TaxID=1081104 RepID=A0A162J348_CORFA|nr:hypothetical protein ISF_04988 [Cordyceps fumosorosea ARSEF 2679]OAA63112.1 hypothetical protein ISF_04988 [Cordyceps fumosorosea ARSEF 2679]